ncbi:adult-specific rigid cuticular protein 15.7 [Rhipicephalus sanguineus]|uniref:adult-specific rigid cuticular protein 15.7 n=1 Tax=Rhipicephalus sanguineus TaxID=34632 RepID=UPI001894C354|nr:adult-specific rigid cuticular protein 15.7 [Rhipicephalus sanguineus]
MWKALISSVLFFAVMANAGNLPGGYGGAAFGGLGAVGVGFGGGYAGRGYLAGGGGGYYGGGYRAYEDNRPKPYSFGYVAQAVGGSSSRQEVGDGNGAVQGVYTITTAEGGQRKVKYTADAAGFRAVVDTNEPGTQSESPADVALRSSSPPAYLLAAKYGPSGSSNAGVRPRAVYGGAGALYGGGAAGYGAAGLYGGLGGRGVGVYAGGAGGGLLGKHGGWH